MPQVVFPDWTATGGSSGVNVPREMRDLDHLLRSADIVRDHPGLHGPGRLELIKQAPSPQKQRAAAAIR